MGCGRVIFYRKSFTGWFGMNSGKRLKKEVWQKEYPRRDFPVGKGLSQVRD
jgi:hypothetical protein